ncbi:MAG TPA: cytochrome c3 family protein, partial [Dermatophilaceae bacterium]
MNKGPARRIRLQAGVAYPVVSAALVASVALAMAPFNASPVMALATSTTPTVTTTVSATPTATPSATSTATPTAAPSARPTLSPEATPTTTTVTPSPTALSSPSSGGVVTQGVPVDHHVVALLEGPESQAHYLAVDAPLTDAAQFQTIRVRFKLHNAGTVQIAAAPQLEYRADGSAGYTVVPEQPLRGVPFRVDSEWVPSPGPDGGTKQGPPGEDIAVAKLLTGNEGGGSAVIGHHSMGVNPDRELTLPPASYTEQEFTVQLTSDARYLTGYQFRITNGAAMLAGTQVATIRLGSPPALRLSPGQQQGVGVGGPRPVPTASAAPAAAPGQSSAGSAFPAVFAASPAAASASSASVRAVAVTPSSSAAARAVGAASSSAVPVVFAASRPNALRYPLVAKTLSAAVVASSDIHGPYSMTADQCGFCHRGHTAKGANLLAKGSQSSLCLSCHDGTGAVADVQAQYAIARPANDPATRAYYSHDAMAPSTHTRSELDEFGGLSNRHSECADCHNS